MRLHKIVLAGGSGYLGGVLTDYYKDKADEILILTRTRRPSHDNVHYVIWNGRDEGPWSERLEDTTLLINLSGKNVNCRYTKKNRAEILRSRLDPTQVLGKVIARLKNPPAVWINVASATIYRHAEDGEQTEMRGEIGEGFSVEVCKAWEKTFWSAKTERTKKILLRVGIVFGRHDGVMPRLMNLVRFGLGGKQGNGRQMVSWIHELDLCRIIEWTFIHGKDHAVYNCTAPEAISNAALMKQLRKAMDIPIGLPAPAWLLSMGAMLIGTETELVLKSRWVYPENLLRQGFEFRFPAVDAAIDNIIGKIH